MKQDVARYVVLRIPPLVHLCQICIYLNTHYQKMDHKLKSETSSSAPIIMNQYKSL